MNDGQEAFRRFTKQLRAVGGSGGRIPGGASGGLFAGSGLLIALVAGGFALNAALFNGGYSYFLPSLTLILLRNSQWMVVTALSSIAGNVPCLDIASIFTNQTFQGFMV